LLLKEQIGCNFTALQAVAQVLVTGLQQLRSLSSLTHLSFDAIARPPLPGKLLRLSFEDAHAYPGSAVKTARSMR
jgi:hypothetical protein